MFQYQDRKEENTLLRAGLNISSLRYAIEVLLPGSIELRPGLITR